MFLSGSSKFEEIYFPFVWAAMGNVLHGVLIARYVAIQPSASGRTCCSELVLFALLSGRQICFVEAETYF
jgi:hypothetical protein